MSLFNQWLKETRVRLGMTQKELAVAVGLNSSQSIANIERGASRFPMKRIAHLCALAKVKKGTVISILVKDYKTHLESRV